MPVVLLVRHAQASFGKPNYDQLSELGYEQATRLGEALRGRLSSPRSVHVGEMVRHRQTAEGCLAALGAAPDSPHAGGLTVDPDLNEFDAWEMLRRHDPLGLQRLKVGVKTLRDRDARAHFEALFGAAMHRWTGGEHEADYTEPWRVFAGRCNAAVDRIAAGLSSGETALVFTSAGPISAVAQRCLGVPGDRVPQLNRMIVNGSVTKLVVGSGGIRLSVFNDHAHLEDRRLLTYR